MFQKIAKNAETFIKSRKLQKGDSVSEKNGAKSSKVTQGGYTMEQSTSWKFPKPAELHMAKHKTLEKCSDYRYSSVAK